MKKARIFFILFAMAFPAILFAEGLQDKQTKMQMELKRICSEILCRPSLDIRLRKEDGSIFESNTGVSLPIVQGGMVTIYPGEIIYLEADAGTEGLQNIRAVEKMSDPTRTMVLKFEQKSGQKFSERFMMLNFSNPFSRPLKYHASMMLLDGKVHKTSSCPVPAGLSAYEDWAQPIFQLILTDFRFVSDKDTKCEY